jgi:hypothetical protein
VHFVMYCPLSKTWSSAEVEQEIFERLNRAKFDIEPSENWGFLDRMHQTDIGQVSFRFNCWWARMTRLTRADVLRRLPENLLTPSVITNAKFLFATGVRTKSTALHPTSKRRSATPCRRTSVLTRGIPDLGDAFGLYMGDLRLSVTRRLFNMRWNHDRSN